MKPAENAKGLKTFIGFIQYLGKFMPNMATESAPLRELLEKNVAWQWDNLQEEGFQKLKQMASSTPVLGYYDPSKPLCLLQDEKPLAYASRALTPTQQWYAQIVKGHPCNCVWSAEISSVHLWKNNRRRNRPQAIAIHLKHALE